VIVFLFSCSKEITFEHEFKIHWLGPYKIEDFVGNNSFYFSLLDGERQPLSVNGEILKMFYQCNV
jgi:hypothetical protein